MKHQGTCGGELRHREIKLSRHDAAPTGDYYRCTKCDKGWIKKKRSKVTNQA